MSRTNWAKCNTVDEFHQPGKILSLERRLEVGTTPRQIHNVSHLLFILRACSSVSNSLALLLRGLQQDVNQELPDVQDGFRKGRETRDQIANIRWIIERAREFHKNINFCFIDFTKAFDCMDHNKLKNSSRDGNIRPPYLPPEIPVCRSGSNSQNQTWNNRLVPNWERSTSRLCIVTLLI